MKYFFDTEFLEGSQKIYQWGLKTDTWLRIAGVGFLVLGFWLMFFKYGTLFPLFFIFPALIMFGISLPKTPPTIDLISIGIVSEDGREYYSISKDFNLKEAWNRYQMKQVYGDQRNRYPDGVKEYWIRENVLKPIFKELREKSLQDKDYIKEHYYSVGNKFSYSHLKELIKYYGKPNKQIASEIIAFTLDPTGEGFDDWLGFSDDYIKALKDSSSEPTPEFYAYYADYDWVAFCWLYGKMIDLPKKFPMYCRDLKQEFDRKLMLKSNKMIGNIDAEEKALPFLAKDEYSLDERLKIFKSLARYPKQENEHNALADARWNLKLYQFLNSI